MTDLSYLDKLATGSAEEVLDMVLANRTPSLACLTCSFQAEDIIVLNLLRKRIPKIPVLFLQTGYHFPETYQFRDQIAREWDLNLVNVMPKKTVAQQESEFGILYRDEPTKCCQLRKVEPLMEALEPFEVWFTGLRREPSAPRKNLRKAEEHRLPSRKTVFKEGPLAHRASAKIGEDT